MFVLVERGVGSKEEMRRSNVVVADGLSFLAQGISSCAPGANSLMAYIAIGTGTTVASLNQTTLVGELKRKGFSASSLSTNSWSAVSTFGGGSDGITGVTFTEVGVFNSPNSGVGKMLNRAIVDAFTLQNSDIATVQTVVKVGSWQ